MIAVLTLVLYLGLVPAAGAEALEAGGQATVLEVVDGDTLVLEDRTEVRLAGIQAPKLPLGRPGFETWPLAQEAKQALAGLTLGRVVTLTFGGRRMDRYGRLLAHLHLSDGRWIQGEMLALGLARVYSFADNRALVEEMLALERAAREASRGIWSHPFYRVIGVEETPSFIDSFQLVEGRVLKVAVVKSRGYLNFGPDWREDFTISIAPRDRKLFEADGARLEDLEGRLVRVRGWIKSFNGPMIEATHPEQIELVDE